MTTVTVLTGEQDGSSYLPANSFDWADLGSSPYGSWSNWTSWRIITGGTVSIQLDDDLGSIGYRTPYMELIQQGDVTITLKISDTGTFTGEETTISFAYETPTEFVAGRYYRWTVTVVSNSEYSTPIIQFFRTIYDGRLLVETLEDVDVFASATTSLSTNLGLVRNIQATALQGDPYVEDGYVLSSQGSSYTRTAASLTNNGTGIVDGVINSAFEVADPEYVRVAMADEIPHGTDDFTVEMNVYVDSSHVGSGDAGYLIYREDDSAGGGDYFFQIAEQSGYAYPTYQIEFDGSAVSPSQSPVDLQITTDTWHHYAVVRTGGTIYLFIDGSIIDTQTIPGGASAFANVTTDFLRIGGSGAANGSFNGLIDEVRISGTARYTTTFTPQTWQFTNDPDTVLLLHAEDYTDDGGIAYGEDPYFIIQQGGSPVIKQKNPPQVQVVDYNGAVWDGTVDVVLRGYPKIQQTQGGVFPLAV